MKTDKKESNYKFYVFLAAFLGLIIFVLIVAYGIIVPSYIKEPSTAGEFGDMYGALNTMFSGWAFVGVIVAILMQSKELELQREELEDTRKVLSSQKDQIEAQANIMSKQQFENTYFELLKLYNNTLDDAKHITHSNMKTQQAVGRKAYDIFYNSFKGSRGIKPFIEEGLSGVLLHPSSHYVAIVDYYTKQSKDQYRWMQPYFRIVYNIVKFIDHSDFNDDDKGYYSGLLRAQLSSSELAFLALNCLSEYGSEKMLPLMVNLRQLTQAVSL